ncbi:hypothetical protein [Chroococcus sp. FPU101]|uniref:hypothetical protein n=1 Tax=Chroococcus sp. FPU101 TaxID=1974212 RepID=UPI001A8E3012|nr:hypothetical protein [Chroococcus sp. FPU101]GFE72228.1 hypothetical protein CFPU101_48380 [Chroococcus sp. FPU101]
MKENPVEIYLKSPTPFMMNNWDRLLPDWSVSPQTIVLVLLNSHFPLDGEGKFIEQEKDRLFKEFIALGEYFYLVSQQQGFCTEIISPKDGTPQYSTKGDLIFDLVAIVHYSLEFNYFNTLKGCQLLKHPVWQTAIYPGLFLSEATVLEVQSILTKFV